MRTLITSDDATVRAAALQLSDRDPQRRNQAIDTLWAYGAAHPGPLQVAIYQVCSAVAEATNHPRAAEFAEMARNISPEDANTWRIYSYSLRRQQRPQEAGAAGLVSQGLDAEAKGDAQAAEQHLTRALPSLHTTEGRSYVESRLSGIRPDWRARRLRSSQKQADQPADAKQTTSPPADQPQAQTPNRTY
jgi:hypothetical protein